jgi:hypothetical protein
MNTLSRDVRWTHRVPDWWRARNLTEIPPHLDDDGYDIIEHIRSRGQVASGAMGVLFATDFIEIDHPPPLDKNAPEREAAIKEYQERLARLKSRKEWLKSLPYRERQEELRAQRLRDRAVWETQQKLAYIEHEEILRKRKQREAQYDAEWEAAAPKTRFYIPHWKRDEILAPYRERKQREARIARVRKWQAARTARKSAAQAEVLWAAQAEQNRLAFEKAREHSLQMVAQKAQQKAQQEAREARERLYRNYIDEVLVRMKAYGRQVEAHEGPRMIEIAELRAHLRVEDRLLQAALWRLGVDWEPPH